MAFRKGVARAGLQITLEADSLFERREGNIAGEPPRPELGGMRRPSGVLLGQPSPQIDRLADIAACRVTDAFQKIDVKDRRLRARCSDTASKTGGKM
jgi:hypothetical protein